MVQVSKYAQWRLDADDRSAAEGSAGDRSAANRRNEEPPPPPPDLKWKPGTGRAAAKVRAKEMRKATEERTERREAIRHARRAHADGCAEDRPSAESRDSVRRDGKKDMKERAYQVWHQSLSLPALEGGDSATEDSRDSCQAAAEGTHAEPEPAPLAPSSVSYDKLPADLWRLVLSHADATTLAACASCAKPLGSLAVTPSLWRAAHARIFGGSISHRGGTIRPLPHCDLPHEAEEARKAEVAEAAEAADAAGDVEATEAAEPSGSWRSACLQSEGMVRGYARAAAAEAQPLPLPAMTDVCLAGGRGVSVHEGRLVRVWDVTSGQRLECRASPRPLVCCHALAGQDALDNASGYDIVGDASGFFRIATSSDDIVERRASQHALVGVRLLPGRGASCPLALTADEQGAISCWSREAAAAAAHGGASPPPAWVLRCSAPALGGGGEAAGGYGLSQWGCDGASFFHSRPSGEVEGFGLDPGGMRPLWRGVPAPDDEAAAVLLRLPAGGRARTGGRPASYSARLGLLAASTGAAVALWDPRVGGNASAGDGASGAAARPVARVPMPAGRAAAFVGLDRGHGTAAPPYHLLVSTGAGVHVLDLRRLGACRAAASGVLYEAAPLVTTFTRPRAALGACFDAERGVVVVGGGPKGACAFRWSAAATMSMSLASVTAASPASPAEVAPQAARREKQPGPKRQPSGAKGRNKG